MYLRRAIWKSRTRGFLNVSSLFISIAGSGFHGRSGAGLQLRGYVEKRRVSSRQRLPETDQAWQALAFSGLAPSGCLVPISHCSLCRQIRLPRSKGSGASLKQSGFFRFHRRGELFQQRLVQRLDRYPKGRRWGKSLLRFAQHHFCDSIT